jgi:hypothetical protein
MGTGTSARRSVLTTLLTFALAAGAMAAGASMASHGPPSSIAHARDVPTHPAADAKDDAGTHGGPIERMHDAGRCDLTDVATLSGNWTHGDYVSAVAHSGKTGDVPGAARSDCGIPTVATQGGSPDQAARHATDGRSTADATSGPSVAEDHAAGAADDHLGS